VKPRTANAPRWDSPPLHRLERRQRRARRHERRYEILLDNLPDCCVLLLSREGRVRAVRGGFAGAAARAAWIGRGLAAAGAVPGILELPHERLQALVAAARQQRCAALETRLQLDARQVDVAITLVDLRAGGEMLCLLRDLSAVRAIEIALLRRNQELSEAAERLQEIDMLKNEFLSNVSHELRTPLTAIIAYTEALQRNRPDESTRDQFLRVIAEQGHKLQKLIAGLLDIAKLDTLATELKLQLAAVNDVIEAAVVTVRPTADKARIRLQLDLAPDLAPVWLDELRAQQIVWNLLANAIKFSPPGSTVRVRSWNAAGCVWVAVSDQGIGIAPEHHELIFQKFVQVDGSSTRRHGGVGLGLDLVKHLVELHGGSVHVDSDLGRGATFSFSIPVEKRRRSRDAAGLRPARAVHES
jgi:signal transduction histidine kinase